MIQNIIFDMGQVVIKFDPEYFMNREGVFDSEDRKTVYREIYKSIEWAMMDRGTLSDEEAYQRMVERLPEHLKKVGRRLAVEWYEPIVEVEGTRELIQELKEKKYRVYLLSNASKNQAKYWPMVKASSYFDGRIVSSEVGHVKPEQEIYECVCQKYQLKKEECVFIDDAPINAEAAVTYGMKGIVYHGDIQELRDKLKAIGVAVS